MKKDNRKIVIYLLSIMWIQLFLAKIFGKIDLEWIWIFSPLLIPFAIIFSVAAIIALIYLIAIILELIIC